MTWTPGPNYPKRYGWKTPITAPGPSGSSMLRRMRTIQRHPIPFLEEVARDFGPVVQLPIPWPVYVVSSPNGARDVLVNHHREVGKRTLQYSTLSLITGLGLLTADTQAWRPRRRMLQPAFHKELVSLTAGHVDAALDRLEARWREASVDAPALVDVDADMMELALEVTGAALFGIDLTDQARAIADATLVALHGVIVRARNPLPMPLAIPTPANWGMTRAIKRLDDAVEQILAARRNDVLPPQAPVRDMLDVLLDPDVEQPLTAQQVRDEIVTFIVAGHETVASALTWAWQLLARDQSAQSALATDASRSMMTFDEALRLYPPAWVITRRAIENFDVDGFHIPAGAMVIVSPWVVHRDKDLWDSPQEFRPERFADGAPQVGYLPFGQGPRLCIGRDMARLEGAQVLARLAANWVVEPVHGGMAEVEASVTLRPVGGLPLRVRPRG